MSVIINCLLSVDYASVVALEVRQPNSDPSQATVRFNFKNGSDPEFTTYNWMGTTGDINLQTLSKTLSVRTTFPETVSLLTLD